jgi:hypothetical protein
MTTCLMSESRLERAGARRGRGEGALDVLRQELGRQSRPGERSGAGDQPASGDVGHRGNSFAFKERACTGTLNPEFPTRVGDDHGLYLRPGTRSRTRPVNRSPGGLEAWPCTTERRCPRSARERPAHPHPSPTGRLRCERRRDSRHASGCPPETRRRPAPRQAATPPPQGPHCRPHPYAPETPHTWPGTADVAHSVRTSNRRQPRPQEDGAPGPPRATPRCPHARNDSQR